MMVPSGRAPGLTEAPHTAWGRKVAVITRKDLTCCQPSHFDRRPQPNPTFTGDPGHNWKPLWGTASEVRATAGLARTPCQGPPEQHPCSGAKSDVEHGLGPEGAPGPPVGASPREAPPGFGRPLLQPGRNVSGTATLAQRGCRASGGGHCCPAQSTDRQALARLSSRKARGFHSSGSLQGGSLCHAHPCAKCEAVSLTGQGCARGGGTHGLWPASHPCRPPRWEPAGTRWALGLIRGAPLTFQ